MGPPPSALIRCNAASLRKKVDEPGPPSRLWRTLQMWVCRCLETIASRDPHVEQLSYLPPQVGR